MSSVDHQTVRLFFHETVHWLDHVSTLWGQRHIVQLFNAINARELNRPEEFWRIAVANAELYRIHYPRYFTVIEQGVDTEWKTSPWKAQLTSGMQFGPDGRLRKDRPILFYRFKNSLEQSICRTPISVASLMEVNATTAELWVSARYLIHGFSAEEREIEEQIQSREATEKLYDPELSEYSVAAHLLANRLGISNGFTAYRLTSALGTLALNLPLSAFHFLRAPKDVELNPPYSPSRGEGDRKRRVTRHTSRVVVQASTTKRQEARHG